MGAAYIAINLIFLIFVTFIWGASCFIFWTFPYYDWIFIRGAYVGAFVISNLIWISISSSESNMYDL